MRALQALGTAQNRKVYARHGAGENLFGVSFANLNRLKKQIGTNHPLAEALWQTGNVDAMSLATMIADPQAFTVKAADDWLARVNYGLLAGLLAGVIARSPLAISRISRWTRARKETTRQAGYDLLCAVLKIAPDRIADDDARRFLDVIERSIHRSPNRARHAMNSAVIAIGVFKPSVRRAAIATARRIGKVDVDHGETSCQTPDAVAYINRAAARSTAKGRPAAGRRRG